MEVEYKFTLITSRSTPSKQTFTMERAVCILACSVVADSDI